MTEPSLQERLPDAPKRKSRRVVERNRGWRFIEPKAVAKVVLEAEPAGPEAQSRVELEAVPAGLEAVEAVAGLAGVVVLAELVALEGMVALAELEGMVALQARRPYVNPAISGTGSGLSTAMTGNAGLAADSTGLPPPQKYIQGKVRPRFPHSEHRASVRQGIIQKLS